MYPLHPDKLVSVQGILNKKAAQKPQAKPIKPVEPAPSMVEQLAARLSAQRQRESQIVN